MQPHGARDSQRGEVTTGAGPARASRDAGGRDDLGRDDPSPDAGRFHLAIFDDCLRSFPLVDGTILVGRSKNNHLQLHDDLLSRKHCTLTTVGDQVTLVDLNSSNGTYVNGQRIGTKPLDPDDIIELGKTVLVLYDGSCWNRGAGMLNLRNPVKAQELVHRLSEGGVGVERSERPVATGPKDNGVRPRKGLHDVERGFLRWLESGESRVLPDLVAGYLHHKLVSLLVRNSTSVRTAFTAVLEDMMRPELFQRIGSPQELHLVVREMVARELADLREEAPAAGTAQRDLLDDDEEEEVEVGERTPPLPDDLPDSPPER